MKRAALIGAAVAAVLLTASGCSSRPMTSQPAASIALGALGPMVNADAPAQPGVFLLGAGDALGQAVFVRYVAFVRANADSQYAGGETPSEF